MKLNGKELMTIPADLRHRHGFVEGDEVDVVEDGTTVWIVDRMRGRASTGRSTDELMDLLRGE